MRGLALSIAALGIGGWACTGQIDGTDAPEGPGALDGEPAGTGRAPGSGTRGGAGSAATGPGSPAPGGAAGAPGSTGPGGGAGFYGADEAQGERGKLLRISPLQYQNMVADVLGTRIDLSQLLEPDLVQASGFRAGFDIAPSVVARYADAAAMVASAVVAAGPSAASCLKTAPAVACTDAVADALVSRLWRRRLAAADRAALHAVVTRGAAAGDAAYAFWVHVLLHPYFLFAVEEPSADGLVSDFELAARLALVLWRSAPDAALMTAAASGALRDPEALRGQVTRMLGQPRGRETVEQFLVDWAGLKPLVDLTLDPKRFPGWSPTVARSYERSMRDLVAVAAAGDLLKALLGESSYWSDDAMLKLLGQTARGTAGRFDFGERRRGGLLTHPAFLAANTSSDAPDIIHRGIFVRRNVLCEPGIALPADLDTSLPPPTSQVTNRDRFDPLLSRQPCGGCHALFQPLGHAFENYDAVGAWRTVDNGVPIQSAGAVPLSLSSRELAFQDAVDLARQLQASAQAGACLTRHWFRYALWAPVDGGAAASLKGAHEAFARGGHAFEALARAFASSEAFRRHNPPEN